MHKLYILCLIALVGSLLCFSFAQAGDLTVDGKISTGDLIATGNVGIGTTEPVNPLHIYKSGSARLKLQTAATSQKAMLSLKSNTDDWDIIHQGDLNYLDFQYEDSSKFVLTDAGNVGIGTTNPLQKLDLQGDDIAIGIGDLDGTIGGGVTSGIQFLDQGNKHVGFRYDGSNFYLETASNSNVPSTWYDSADSADFIIRLNGNVGIGTTAPAEKLEVTGNIKLSGATPTYKITNVAQPTADSDVATKAYVDAAGGAKTWYRTSTTALGAGAGSLCASGYHMCYPGEWISRSWDSSLGDNTDTWAYPAWVDYHSNANTAAFGDCYSWTSSSGANYGSTAATTSQAGGGGWLFAGVPCSTARSAICCSD